jgi:hypothetical protein
MDEISFEEWKRLFRTKATIKISQPDHFTFHSDGSVTGPDGDYLVRPEEAKRRPFPREASQ